MKYDFIVHPGGNTSDIKINYLGVNGLTVNNKGQLVIGLSTGEIKEIKLSAYQNINGKRITVPCYFVQTNNSISFDFPDGSPIIPVAPPIRTIGL